MIATVIAEVSLPMTVIIPSFHRIEGIIHFYFGVLMVGEL